MNKLERNRFSVFTDDLTKCFICGSRKDHLHELFEGKNRTRSMIYGAVLPVCCSCHQELHNNRQFALIYKREFQQWFELSHTREEFIKIFGRNYL